MKKIFKLPNEVKRYYYTSAVVYSILRGFGLLSPLLMKVIIDIVLPNQDFGSIIILIILFCMIPVVSTLVDVLYFRWINGVIWKKSLKINHKVFSNIIDQPLNYFADKDIGDLMNLYKSDVTRLYCYYLIDRPKLFSQGIVAVIVVLSIFSINPWIGMIQLLLLPLIIFPTKKIFDKVSTLSKDLFKNNGQRFGVVNECFRNIKSVKVNLLGSFYSNKLLQQHEDLINIWKQIFTFDILATAWGNSFISPLNLAVAFIIAVRQVMLGEMSMGSMILILSYVPIFANFLVNFSSTNIQLAQKNQEFSDVLKMSESDCQTEDYLQNEIESIESISFEDVDFYYQEKEILKGINFSLKKGDVVHLKGQNGSGKSTLLDLLMGLKPAQSGSVKINDIDIDFVNRESFYKCTAYMIQDIELPSLSLREFFKIHRTNVSDDEIYQTLKSVRVDIDSIRNGDGLDTTIMTTVSNFSGGEKRKILMAAMMIKTSNLIILDEFTANADSESVSSMKTLIKRIAAQKDKIIILVSHDEDLSDLSNLCIDLG